MNSTIAFFSSDRYLSENKITQKGTLYYCHIEKDEYLHVFFYGLDDIHIASICVDLSNIGKNINDCDYLSFIKDSNGALLYSASVNLFGFENRDDSFEDSPSSIIKMNLMDSYSKDNPNLLLIGNCPCSLGGNINIYYDLDAHSVVYVHEGRILSTFGDMAAFLLDIKNMYYDKYRSNGKHRYYGEKDKYVYNNIQKYIVRKESQV